jgi:hypothetical protein
MKLWKITVSDKADPEVAKKLKRVLKPFHDISQRPQKCLFCGVETSWTINDKPVCPKCSIDHGFLDKGWATDPCEVCGQQGEWWTEGKTPHFLCHIHLHDWFHWKIPELDFIDGEVDPEGWSKAWGTGWNRFIAHMKEMEAKKLDKSTEGIAPVDRI